MHLRQRILWRTLLWALLSIGVMVGGFFLFARIQAQTLATDISARMELGYLLIAMGVLIVCALSQVAHWACFHVWDTWLWYLSPVQIDILIEELKDIRAMRRIQDMKDPLRKEIAKIKTENAVKKAQRSA
tara:strand:- start:295 stop:684 length:390 start_codon:yes stop_codon:yes gene_type:complete